jgi:hypothetical protein
VTENSLLRNRCDECDMKVEMLRMKDVFTVVKLDVFFFKNLLFLQYLMQ